MAEYHVTVRETNYGWVTVEADSEEEAIKMALEDCEAGDVDWQHTDHEIGEVERQYDKD